MPESRYWMSLSLNVLNHLGLNLYSNTPAVLAEVIANAWDADATEVKIDFNLEEKLITISDNGHGMDVDDINRKYLTVGYNRRNDNNGFRTPRGRQPMGRKGIGKLSLFSIANKFEVHSLKKSGDRESFLMDAASIKSAIQDEDPSSPGRYEPDEIDFDADIESQGTVIKITDLKKLRLTRATVSGLRKRIARRFGIIDDHLGFRILVDGSEVGFSERDYFHKARFLFQYGSYDYSQHCTQLDVDTDTGEPMAFLRSNRFESEDQVEADRTYETSGWIGIARHSNSLDEENPDENLNRITIVVRGKVAQEDILQEYRLGGMITKFIYGEFHADFLDEDDLDDIATSGRQKILEDDPRYLSLKGFIGRELKYIWTETNKLKERKGLDNALDSNPYIREWFEGLRPKVLQQSAQKMFGVIDQATIDERHKHELYANGILAFEARKIDFALEEFDLFETDGIERMLTYLHDIDNIEAERYHEIVKERLKVIERFRGKIDANEIERLLQEYIFDHLWLLDPSWERATEYAYMEEHMKTVIDRIDADNPTTVRPDIRYRRISGAHVIIELKRASVWLNKTEIEAQLLKYRDALENELKNDPNEFRHRIESVCIVGRLPRGWDDAHVRQVDEASLNPYFIRVMTYRELIDNAYAAYGKFIEASHRPSALHDLIERVRTYKVVEDESSSGGEGV